MGEFRTFSNACQHGFGGDVAELHRHIHFIQYYELDLRIAQIGQCRLPSLLHELLVAGSVLGFPGEPLP